MKGKNNGLSRSSLKVTPQQESTSRHQLRSMDYSGILEPTAYTLSNMRLKFFLAEMARKIKFLTPPLTHTDKIIEEWQNSCRNEQSDVKNGQQFGRETLTEELLNRFSIMRPFQVGEGILLLLFCWMVSVSFVFQIKIMLELSLVVSLLTLCKLALKLRVICVESQKDAKRTYEIDLMEDFLLPCGLLAAAGLMIIRSRYQLGLFGQLLAVYEAVIVILHWRRIGKYFSPLTRYAQQNKMRKQLRIIELFCFTIAMAHLFALIMYAMIYVCPSDSQNWLQKAKLQDQPWYIHYVYSFYWANTTMVTVGYGDLTPNNFVQAIIVTMIQMLGTAIFGYMINVIGITVNEIQKKNLQFQEHQATILKMKDHYNITRELCYKMKNDIKKKESQSKETPLKNNEETQFLEYIDSSLKVEFVLETNMKVIKKSIFFLTHFTVNFQNEIALKLIRCIYKPQETLCIQEGGERQLVIINNGRVDIFCVSNIHNPDKAVLARTIKPQEGNPTLNVFGFSSLILNRPINLKAVTQDTTTAYILKRKDLMQSISKSVLDFQSFNELREKMLLMRRVEGIEAPSIRDIERHYIPNIYLLTKKVKYLKQQRMKARRSSRRMVMKVITFKHYQNKTLLMIPHNIKDDEYQSNCFIDFQEKGHGTSAHRTTHARTGKSVDLDQSKIFVNFLKNFNINTIAIDYQKACMKKSYNKRCRAISRRPSTKKMIKE